LPTSTVQYLVEIKEKQESQYWFLKKFFITADIIDLNTGKVLHHYEVERINSFPFMKELAVNIARLIEVANSQIEQKKS